MASLDQEFIHTNDPNTRMNTLLNTIRTMDYDTLQKQVYVCFANGCILLTSFLQQQGQPGWSAELRNEQGQSVLSPEEQKGIEEAFAKADWLLPYFTSDDTKQEGGAFQVPQLNPGGSMIQTGKKLTGDDVSIDKLFQGFMKRTQQLDEYWDSFARNDPGFSKLFMEGDIMVPTPNPAITIPVPKKPLVQLLVTLLDLFRLSAGFAGSNSLLLTLVVFMEELITGQWRQMIMTSLAFLSPSGMAVGVLFKYLINAWQLISPDLRTKLATDMFMGTKSLFIGFLLWCASTFPPSFVKERAEEAIGKLRQMIEQFEGKIDALAGTAKAELEKQGLTITFPELQLDKLKKISLADIQNLQTLARWPVLVCTKEFQDILTPLKADPIFRLILELSNIPVLDEDRYEVCKTDELKTLSEAVADAATPSVIPLLDKQSGGKRKKQTTKRVKTKSTKRSTR